MFFIAWISVAFAANCTVNQCGTKPIAQPKICMFCPSSDRCAQLDYACTFNSTTQSCKWKLYPVCPKVCSASDCGVKPLGVPKICKFCPSGGCAHLDYKCGFDAKLHSCKWNLTATCPKVCKPSDCGVEPRPWCRKCEHGYVGGGCTTNTCKSLNGTCKWVTKEPPKCVPRVCTPADCGTQPPPSILKCPYGSTGRIIC